MANLKLFTHSFKDSAYAVQVTYGPLRWQAELIIDGMLYESRKGFRKIADSPNLRGYTEIALAGNGVNVAITIDAKGNVGCKFS